MKTINLNTSVKILHYQGFVYQEMKVESQHLKKYDFCNHSIFNFKTLK